MKTSIGTALKLASSISLSLALYGCARDPISPPETQSGADAQQSDIVIADSQPGVSPFISSVQFSGQSLSHVISVSFTIAPMPNSVSSPVNVTWSRAALAGRGYLGKNLIHLPVFGLYAGYQNQVTFQFAFDDGSVQQLPYQIVTAPYTDPTGVYLNPTIVKARSPGSTLGFNFFILKSHLGSPVIVDTDGQVRWVVPEVPYTTFATYFANGQFMAGSGTDVSGSLFFNSTAHSPHCRLTFPNLFWRPSPITSIPAPTAYSLNLMGRTILAPAPAISSLKSRPSQASLRFRFLIWRTY